MIAEYGEESRRAFEFFRSSDLDAVREFWNTTLKRSLETEPADSAFRHFSQVCSPDSSSPPRQSASTISSPFSDVAFWPSV